MALSPDEWEEIEREEHDRYYGNSDIHPFGQPTLRIDLKRALAAIDHGYKAGTIQNLRGHRTRRMLEMMDYQNLAGKRVIDVGCGQGQMTVLLALLGAEVWSFDISPVGVEVAKRMAEANGVDDRCHFSVQSASKMDYPSDYFDIVMMHEVLHHAIKYPGVREETLRILKPGGIAICAETIRGNKLLDMARKISMRGEEAKGDVVLDLHHLKEFSEGFRSVEIEQMAVIYMLKRVFQWRRKTALVRGVLFALKRADDALLAVWPGASRYGGECVVRWTK